MEEPHLLQSLNTTALKLKHCRELKRKNECLWEQMSGVEEAYECIINKLLVVNEQYKGAVNNLASSFEEDNLDVFKDNLSKVLDIQHVRHTVEAELVKFQQETSELMECIRKINVETANFLLHMDQLLDIEPQAQKVEVVPDALEAVNMNMNQPSFAVEKIEIQGKDEVKISELQEEQTEIKSIRENNQQLFTMEEKGEIFVQQEVLPEVEETDRDLDQRKIDCETND